MSTRSEFAQKVVAAGGNADQIKAAMDLYRQKNGAFDDERPAPPPSNPDRPGVAAVPKDISLKESLMPNSLEYLQAHPEEVNQTLPSFGLFKASAKDVGKDIGSVPKGISDYLVGKGQQLLGGQDGGTLAQNIASKGNNFVDKVIRDPSNIMLPFGGEIGSLAEKAVPALGKSLLSKIGTGALRTGVEGSIQGAGGAAVNGQDISQGALQGAAVGGGLGAIGPMLSKVPGALKEFASGVFGSDIKATQAARDAAARGPSGTIKDAIFENDVAGNSIPAALDKTRAKLNDLEKQKWDLINQQQGQTANLYQLYNDAMAKVDSKSGKNFAIGNEIEKEKNDLLDRIHFKAGGAPQVSIAGQSIPFNQLSSVLPPANLQTILQKADIPLSDLQHVKSSVGEVPGWNKMNKNAASSAQDIVNAAYYQEIMKEMEKKVPGIKEINAQQQDLIPVEEALNRRVSQMSNNDKISLPMMIALSSSAASLGTALNHPLTGLAAAALPMARVASKSPMVARGAYSLGRSLEDPSVQSGLDAAAGLGKQGLWRFMNQQQAGSQ